MKTHEYPSTSTLRARAAQVIPCGVYGHFAPMPDIPASDYPFFASKAQGSKFWDVDGNEFIDYMCCGHGANILGYNHPVVDEAFHAQMKLADTVSIASPILVELAELLVDTVSIADWAFFARSGADVMNYAIHVARARTLRAKIVNIKVGYHGTPLETPWMTNQLYPGMRYDVIKDIIPIPWNDAAALERVIDEHHGQVAAFIASPYQHLSYQSNQLPAHGYWRKVEQLLRDNGIVFILDDRTCGFRLDLRGSNELYGFKPDLICFSNGIANGYPLAALVGTDLLKNNNTATFLGSAREWCGAGCMAAAVACIKELKRIDAPALLRRKGSQLSYGMAQVAKSHGYTLEVMGEPAMPYMRLTDGGATMFEYDLRRECARRGAFITSFHDCFITTAHTDEDIQRTLDIFDDALGAVKQLYGV